MSVIGIDFGSESCLVTAVRKGFIETLTNEYSVRATPNCVAFDDKKRIIGVAAKNQQVMNMTNTISGFKHLLGRSFNDPQVQRELSLAPITAHPGCVPCSISIKVNYLGKETWFTPVQLTAMVLSKLKDMAVNSLQTQVNSCVLTCPVFFTNAERKALLDACHVAGLNCVRLMNETTATALHYGFYKNDLEEEKARNVIFVDCGHSSLQASACAFYKGKLKVLACTWDKIGGRDIDVTLAQYFAKEFQDRYKINVSSNARAYLRLLAEVEKLKKQMSANNDRLPLSIECFIDDIDVQATMQRGQMEQLCANFFKRTEAVFRKLLLESKLNMNEIHAVEIVGGSTRIPAIKLLIEQVFGLPASTTLNQDESVSSGATLQCALSSSLMRVREFSIGDIQNFAVKVCWDGEGTSSVGGELLVFAQNHAVPFSRMLTLCRREPFGLTVEYAQEIPYTNPVISKYTIKNVKPNERGEAQEIRVKVRVNHHGIVLIPGACLVDKKEVSNEEPNTGSNIEEQQSNTNTENTEGSQESIDKKKNPNNLIELPIESKPQGYTLEDLEALKRQEIEMIRIDANEKERADARNALEEYVYDMREKFGDGGALERYFLHDEREAFCAHLQELAVWLYAEGENCDRDAYVAKLEGLRNKTKMVNERARDYESKEYAFEELKSSLMRAREVAQGSTKHKHLTDMERQSISDICNRVQKWYEINLNNFMQSPRTTHCPLNLDDILQQTLTLTTYVDDVIKETDTKYTVDQQSAEALHENQVKTSESTLAMDAQLANSAARALDLD